MFRLPNSNYGEFTIQFLQLCYSEQKPLVATAILTQKFLKASLSNTLTISFKAFASWELARASALYLHLLDSFKCGPAKVSFFVANSAQSLSFTHFDLLDAMALRTITASAGWLSVKSSLMKNHLLLSTAAATWKATPWRPLLQRLRLSTMWPPNIIAVQSVSSSGLAGSATTHVSAKHLSPTAFAGLTVGKSFHSVWASQ